MRAPAASTAGWSRQDWTDALARRVWCYGLGQWLAEFGSWLGYRPGEVPPASGSGPITLASAEKGITAVLHTSYAGRAMAADPDAWVISQLDFDAEHAPLPFGLDSRGDTPESVAAKLGDDTAAFPQRHIITYYLPDDRVVAVEYRPRQGIAAVHVTRLKGAVLIAD